MQRQMLAVIKYFDVYAGPDDSRGIFDAKAHVKLC